MDLYAQRLNLLVVQTRRLASSGISSPCIDATATEHGFPRLRGLSRPVNGKCRRATLWTHVLRNAMIPVLTIMGLQFANRDLVVVRDVVMLLVAVVMGVNFAVDVLYALVDPRLRAER